MVQAARLAMPSMYLPHAREGRPGLDEVPGVLLAQLGAGAHQGVCPACAKWVARRLGHPGLPAVSPPR